MKKILFLIGCVIIAVFGCEAAKVNGADSCMKVVAYVTSWSEEMPDPKFMTHINYAFGHVNESFDGVRIDNPVRLSRIARLKKVKPELKVLLSVGGWGSGRFSEMAADPVLRGRFAADCRRVADEYGLDGIDIDWEYPGSNAAGISASEADPGNFVKLLAAIRDAIGPERLLTIASSAWGTGCRFSEILPYVDFINIMTYDMAQAPSLHNALYSSGRQGGMSAEKGVAIHLGGGVPASKFVLGIPFYGRGASPYQNFVDYKDVALKPGCTEGWDDVAKTPYIADKSGSVVLGFENPKSIGYKCDFIVQRGLGGAMYWDYAGDNAGSELREAVARGMGMDLSEPTYPADYAGAPRFKALIYYNDQAEPAHVDFAKDAIDFFHRLSYGDGYRYDVTTSLADYPYDRLKGYDLIVAINASPVADKERKAFEEYMENGGGWIGFHAAAYNDANTGWDWYNRFLGAGKFYCNTWPPQPALADVELREHPVTKNLPQSFVLPECEWYQWQPDPRLTPGVEVLLSLSPANYTLGIKDVVKSGDFPVVWTNTRYRMIYLNIGHGDREFTDAAQNLLLVNAFRWIAASSASSSL